MGTASAIKAARSQRAALAKGKRQARQHRSRRDSQAERYLLLICQGAILLVVAWQLYQHALEIRPMISARFQFDYEEGNILNALTRIVHGLSPYPDPHAFPNVLNPYGPVAYYVLALPARLLGVSFAGPRMVIVVSMLAICIFIALVVERLTRSALTGVVFGLMYGTFGLVRHWSAILRIDLLALALTTAGFYFFSHAHSRNDGSEPGIDPQFTSGSVFGNFSAWLAAALFTAAIFTKPNCIAAPAACLAYLLLQRRWREALKFSALGVALCAISLITTWRATGGTIATHLFYSHPDPFSWSAYMDKLAQLPGMFAPLLVLSLAALVPEIRQKRLSLATLWLIFSTLTAVTAGKLGSNWNHFLEWPIALCVCAGMGWGVVTRLRPHWLVAVLSLLATLWLGLMVLAQKPTRTFVSKTSGCPAAYEFVRSQPGDRILSENVGALVLGGKKVWVSNLFVLTQLIEHAGWRDPGLKTMLDSRSFDLVVASRNYLGNKTYSLLGADRFTPEAIQSLAKNYHAVASFECRDAEFVFVPNR